MKNDVKNNYFVKIVLIVCTIAVLVFQSCSLAINSTSAETKERVKQAQLLATLNLRTNDAGEYMVASVDDFKSLASFCINDGDTQPLTFRQTKDIDFSGCTSGVNPIGREECMFKGTYYGDGYLIKNFKVNDSTWGIRDRGLFGYVDGGKIYDIVAVDADIWGSNNKSAGVIAGSIYNGTVIQDCMVFNSNVRCWADTDSTLGGIVGYIESASATISDCFSNAYVHATGYGTVKCGGIAGLCYGASSITGCLASGTVTAGDTNTGVSYAGGIIAETQAIITNCLNKATVSSYVKTSSSSSNISPLSLASTQLDGEGKLKIGTIKSGYVREAVPGGDTYSLYLDESGETYRGGIAGKQTGGAISYCINIATTNYETAGTTSGQRRTHNLYYTIYWDKTIGPSYSNTYLYYNLRANYYNALVGFVEGGTLSNCYHPKTTTTSYNTFRYEVSYYKRSNNVWSNVGYATDTFDKMDYYSQKSFGTITGQIEGPYISTYNYNAPTPTITKITYGWIGGSAYGAGTFVPLYSFDFPSPTWINSCELQESVDMKTVTNNDSSVWEIKNSTPRLKKFYWENNVVVPS